MTVFDILTLIGGVTLFLFGMKVMGAALEKLAGSRMKNILEQLTSSRMKGMLLGALLTAVIQSSSATSVMVVGFVNSGLMKVAQATGVVMGANIGTTVTGWILSLSGIEGESVLMRLLKPSSFTPILGLVGIALLMASKRGRKQSIGMILMGFSVLMFGMNTMSSAVAPLKTLPEFTAILTRFENPFIGILVGALLTATLQSSSASIGILQALAFATGTIGYHASIPIMLGMNIGAVVPVFIASIGTNRNARTVAFIYLYYNIIGAALFLAVFTLLDSLVHFSFMASMATPVGLAAVNTAYKIFATAVLMPAAGWLEKLAARSVRGGKEHSDKLMLDRRLLSTPSVALERCRVLTCEMSREVCASLISAIGLMDRFDEKTAEAIREAEDKADVYEDKLGTYLVDISGADLSPAESAEASMLLHSIGDFERISDHAVNIVEVTEELHGKRLRFSYEAEEDLRVIASALTEILRLATDSFCSGDAAMAKKVEPLEEVIDYLRTEIKRKHIVRLQEGRCTIELGFVLSDLLTNFERASDHCSNIAVCVIETGEGSFGAHEYMHDLKLSGDAAFEGLYREYRKKYEIAP